MSILARQTVRSARTALRQQQPLLRRNLHVENTHETVIPFPSGPTRKVPVAISLTTFLVVGFSLPFVAAKFQIAKASW
ncbi:related to COX8-cytochrome-c oxidase chain VIII [Sporisorium reilianum f. sp. reilianum]|uniref:Cytochrome c oxidase subunit 8, mitochondrial n=1 Tax=Sporisorium reilianum f. sp. reilianum TaxID=72559 RepID=A0A2N8U6A0_9BASI|nr:related to COX8-cytochrome-c oxidase chain VIII [Sporisorium reilianum f. sp. reilianum]